MKSIHLDNRGVSRIIVIMIIAVIALTIPIIWGIWKSFESDAERKECDIAIKSAQRKLVDEYLMNPDMTLEEAVLFAKDAEAKLFIPLHIDMFAMNTIPKSYIPAGVDQYNKGMPYHIFTPGERFIFMK